MMPLPLVQHYFTSIIPIYNPYLFILSAAQSLLTLKGTDFF